jgi:hypothetical protein
MSNEANADTPQGAGSQHRLLLGVSMLLFAMAALILAATMHARFRAANAAAAQYPKTSMTVSLAAAWGDEDALYVQLVVEGPQECVRRFVETGTAFMFQTDDVIIARRRDSTRVDLVALSKNVVPAEGERRNYPRPWVLESVDGAGGASALVITKYVPYGREQGADQVWWSQVHSVQLAASGFSALSTDPVFSGITIRLDPNEKPLLTTLVEQRLIRPPTSGNTLRIPRGPGLGRSGMRN